MAHPLVGARRTARRPAAPATAARLQPRRPTQPGHRQRAAGRPDPTALARHRPRRLPHVRRQAPHRGHRHETTPRERPGRGDLPTLRPPRTTRRSWRRSATRAAKPTTPARQQVEYEAREREYKEQLRRAAEQQKAEREPRRPACANCGTRYTDARWRAIEPAGSDAPRETHPHLCDDCRQRATHRRTPSPANRARAPGARLAHARAEDRRHLDLTLPPVTRPDPAWTVMRTSC